ncbi:MAG: hypothetical protein A2X13_04635 [Bacteroidetes bacterium GWC2_33_15]|nr:MAG: hypothetical protein A2X10_06480 [Bacteroidetes bacterium GWA2_33_15]OFX49817.1 MAG: hypothetical protein A2X13_04635 [Bacteroidetes bacterium GWC2_33_15]OFX65008.1 MAG: hypothetical protein A2X15_06555 [Bacteroidetes bacterium GWB2_32_14]OFX69030.1 MAG: hypothetical protein A2X14_13600 [Bacteroidetes bacterium GWD2_33_33]HAN18299.1 hypothetical protein [Bacteroidales bacterium]
MREMYKSIFLLFVALISIQNISAKTNDPTKDKGTEDLVFIDYTISSPEMKSATQSDGDTRLKLINLQIDVLGIVFFGPQVSLDFQVANFISVGPYFRWNYGGLMYQATTSEWFSESPDISPASYGYGFSAKVLPPIGSGRHRPYIDLGFERFSGKESWYSDSYSGDHYYEYKANIFHFGAGYRMVSDGAFNLSVGIFVGIYQETENIDYYENSSEIEYNSLEDPRVFPGANLTLGWQFGGK